MTAKNQAELSALLEQLDPTDRAAVLQFAKMRQAQRKADMKPITAEEWERLPFWVRKSIYWGARCFVFLDTRRKRKSA